MTPEEQYLQRVTEWLIVTKGEEGLKLLLDKETAKQAMLEYNKAYESFVYKFLQAPRSAREQIIKAVMANVYFALRSN